MRSPFVDPSYLAYQYDNSEKLRIRIETHQLYTEGGDDFADVELRHINPRPGWQALDVGCGPGRLAQMLHHHGTGYVGLERSAGLVREARSRTDAAFVQGDAGALPFAEAQFDLVMAMGVLYHLRDWQGALREMRRVTRPGGRVVLSTSGPDAMRRIYDVHYEAAIELGYTPLPFGGSAFNLGHLAEVRAVFPTVECHTQESALVFPEAEPALRFYATNRIDMVEGWQGDGSHRARLLPVVRARIEQIIAQEGSFSVPKSFGYFVATV